MGVRYCRREDTDGFKTIRNPDIMNKSSREAEI